MDDRQFWAQMRRGLLTMTAAIDQHYGRRDPFWRDFRYGLADLAKAIERGHRFPRHSVGTLGHAHDSEPPLTAPALPQQGVETGGIQ